MTEKPKRQPPEKPKRTARRAPIEFIAPFSLDECVERLDLLNEENDFQASANLALEMRTMDVVAFHIRKKKPNSSSYQNWLYMRGYLKPLDDTATLVVASTRMSPGLMILTAVLGIMLPCSLFSQGDGAKISAFWLLLGLSAVLIFAFMERMALIQCLRHTLRAEVGEAY